ncbi:hypothetical protein DFH09DRAFT_1088629 [Mycena vulgaris]|nr:hypothetical protein DFH09DRAFT_1088629 [Mycena vulgaris]
MVVSSVISECQATITDQLGFKAGAYSAPPSYTRAVRPATRCWSMRNSKWFSAAHAACGDLMTVSVFCGIPQLGRVGMPRLASAPDAASNNGKQKSRSTTPIKTTLFKWSPSWTGSVFSKRCTPSLRRIEVEPPMPSYFSFFQSGLTYTLISQHLHVQSNPILNGFLVQLRAGRRFRAKIKGRAEFKAKILIRTHAGLNAHLQLRKHQRAIATGEPSPLVIPQRAAKSFPKVVEKRNLLKKWGKQVPIHCQRRVPHGERSGGAGREREDGTLLGTRAHSRERVCGEQRDSPLALLPPGTPRTSSSTPPAGHARARSDRDLGSPRARSLHRPASRSPSYLYPRAPSAARAREEPVLRPAPRSPQRRRRTPHPRTTAAPRTNVPRSPSLPHHREHGIPASARRSAHTVSLLVLAPPNAARASSTARARGVGAAPRPARRGPGAALLALAPHLRALVATPTPCPAPRWPRTRTPERRAHASQITSPAVSPRARGLDVSLAARLSARARAVLLASPRTCTRSPSAASRSASPRVRGHDASPRRAAPRTCTPARAQGGAAARSSSYLQPRRPRAHAAPSAPCSRRAFHREREESVLRCAGFVPDSPPASPRARAGVVRTPASVNWDDTRRISARAGRGGHGTRSSARRRTRRITLRSRLRSGAGHVVAETARGGASGNRRVTACRDVVGVQCRVACITLSFHHRETTVCLYFNLSGPHMDQLQPE